MRFVDVGAGVWINPAHVVAVIPGPPVRVRTVDGRDLPTDQTTPLECVRLLVQLADTSTERPRVIDQTTPNPGRTK